MKKLNTLIIISLLLFCNSNFYSLGKIDGKNKKVVYYIGNYEITEINYSSVKEFDTLFNNSLDRTVQIPSKAKIGKENIQSLSFYLPNRTIAWSYYIGVGSNGLMAYDEAVKNFQKKSRYTKYENYGPLFELALEGNCNIKKNSTVENFEYLILDSQNADLYKQGLNFKYVKKGFGSNDFSKVNYIKITPFTIFLINNNLLKPIDVTIKIVSVSLKKKKKVK
jgi:hypothetical protein